MTPRQKIAVIGAGIIGVMCARALRDKGHSVTLFDPAGVANGCSMGNAGYIAVDEALPMARPDVLKRVPSMMRDKNAPLSIRAGDFGHLLPWFMRFAWATRPTQVRRGAKALGDMFALTRDLWPQIMRDSGLNHMVQQKGMLKVYESMPSFQKGAVERDAQRQAGAKFSILNSHECREIIPGLSENICRAVWLDDAYHFIDPQMVTRQLAEGFFEEGGHLEELAVHKIATEGGCVKGVITQKGLHDANAVVVAAGHQSRDLLQAIGVKMPLVAERGYHAMVEHQGFDAGVTSIDRGFLMTPMRINGGKDSLRLAGTVEFARHGQTETWSRAERLLENARALLPQADLKVSSRWMGSRPTLPDFLPAVGKAQAKDGLFIACGHQHLGLTLSAITGQLISTMIEGDTPPIDVSAIDPNRF